MSVLSLTINNARISGWTSVRVTRGIEQATNQFSVGMTERFALDEIATICNAGDPVEVRIDGELLITGYVDQTSRTLGPDAHGITVTGRGKCQDLVDCSAEIEKNQVGNTSVKQFAQQLAKPYGITVRGEEGAKMPQVNVAWGENALALLERLCGFSGLLLYEDPDGSLVLGKLGTKYAAGGVIEGQNVLSATVSQDMHQRYSETVVKNLSITPIVEIGEQGNEAYVSRDVNVKRHRRRYTIADAPNGVGNDFIKLFADWDTARRAGRSNVVTCMVDSWRDANGELWTPNTLCYHDMPTLRSTRTWLISEVIYTVDEDGGEVAQLKMMPPQAFTPQPVRLQPYIPDAVPQ